MSKQLTLRAPAGARSGRIRRWVLVILIVAAALGASYASAMRRQIQNQNQLMSVMTTLYFLEHLYSGACVVDADGDGKGEFGFMGELLEHWDQSTYELPKIALLNSSNEDARRAGIATCLGYYVTVYLPTRTASGIRADSHPKVNRPEDADLQEERFIIYAWPVSIGLRARAALAMDMAFRPWLTLNAGFQNYEGLDRIPDPDAALRPGKVRMPDPGECAPEPACIGNDGFGWHYMGN